MLRKRTAVAAAARGTEEESQMLTIASVMCFAFFVLVALISPASILGLVLLGFAALFVAGVLWAIHMAEFYCDIHGFVSGNPETCPHCKADAERAAQCQTKVAEKP
jgi:hypothetical protein